SMAWSIGLGLIFITLFRCAAKKAHAGVPTGFLNFVEMIIEFIDKTVKDGFQHKSAFIAPLALTISVWVFLMNLMDLLPVDSIPDSAMWIVPVPHFYFKLVSIPDLNITMALGLTVFPLMTRFSIPNKGLIGFIKELTFHPFQPSLRGAGILFAPLRILI